MHCIYAKYFQETKGCYAFLTLFPGSQIFQSIKAEKKEINITHIALSIMLIIVT